MAEFAQRGGAGLGVDPARASFGIELDPTIVFGGGGRADTDYGGFSLIDSALVDNSASESGGGVSVFVGGELTDVELRGNRAPLGGAIAVDHSQPPLPANNSADSNFAEADVPAPVPEKNK